MKMKKLVSAIASLTIAASSFAAFTISASAANIEATLDYTAHAAYGKAADTNGAGYNNEQEYFNYDSAKADQWVSYAFAQFSFTIPEGQNVKNATLTWGGTSGKGYTSELYYLNAGKTLDYQNLTTGTNYGYGGEKTWITQQGSLSGGVTGITTDVTTAVSAMVEASQNYVIFQWTGNQGGANLYGYSSANAPKLTIETTEAVVYTVTYKVHNVAKDATETVISGDKPTDVPDVTNYIDLAAKADYTFTGWTKDLDAEHVYSSDDVKGMAITADTTFTASYTESKWSDDIIYQSTVLPIVYGVKADKTDGARNSSFSIGASVDDDYEITFTNEPYKQYKDGNNAYFNIMFTNESNAAIAGITYYGETNNAIYFTTTTCNWSNGGSGQWTPDLAGANAVLIAESRAPEGATTFKITIDQQANTATLNYSGKDYTLNLTNKATKINSVRYGGYRWNYGKLSDIIIKDITSVPPEPEVEQIEWTTDTDFGYKDTEGVKTGTVRFLAGTDAADNDAEATVGFKFANVTADDFGAFDGKVEKTTTGFDTANTYYSDITDIAADTPSLGIYAVPYIVTADGTTYWGTPFTSGTLEWSDGNKIVDGE